MKLREDYKENISARTTFEDRKESKWNTKPEKLKQELELTRTGTKLEQSRTRGTEDMYDYINLEEDSFYEDCHDIDEGGLINRNESLTFVENFEGSVNLKDNVSTKEELDQRYNENSF